MRKSLWISNNRESDEMKNNMDILMIVHTMGNLKISDNDRFTYIAKKLLDDGNKVEIVTSNFEHHKKSYRDKKISQEHPFKITFLHENAYQKNVSVKRILGHLSFSKRLKKYLKNRKKPDIIYCAIPPTSSSYTAAKYCKKNNIRFVIDVQDLWPETFSIALGHSKFVKILLSPIANMVNQAYKQADEIIAVSNTYVNRALKNNRKLKYGHSVFLGTDGTMVDEFLSTDTVEKPNNEFWVGYIGNLGQSYDFLHVFQALEILKKQGFDNIKFMIVGDGDRRNELASLSKTYFSNTEITGYLPYNKMFEYLKKFDIALNPIVAGAANSVVNKVGDYAAAGIPVVNTQDNEEYRQLLCDYNAGVNTIPENAEDIADKIRHLYLEPQTRLKMGNNNRKMFDDKFDRSKTYQEIIDCFQK